MKKIVGAGFAITAALAASLGWAQAPKDTTTVVVQADRASLKREWVRAESQHFIVYSDTSRENVARLLDNLERFRFVMRQFSEIPETAAEPRLTMYYLADEGELKIIDPQAPPHAIGLYQGCEDGVQGFAVVSDFKPRPGVPVEQQSEDTRLTYVFQAYARHFFYAHFSQHMPQWYVDGYAQYFSSVRFDGNDAIVGMAPEALASYIAGLEIGAYKPHLTYQDLVNDNDDYRIDQMSHVAANESSAASARSLDRQPTTPLSQIDPEHADERERAITATEFQARAWLMTHWLFSSTKNLSAMQADAAALSQGDDRYKAFTKAFGKMPAEMEPILSTYLHKQAHLTRLRFKALPAAEVTFDDEPAAANRLMLDAAALQGCPSPAYGRGLLADIRTQAAQFSDSALARTTLSRAEIAFGDPAKALPWLLQETREVPQDFEAQHLLGRAELAVAQSMEGVDRAGAYVAADKAFTQAAKIDATSAVNAFWYYRDQVTGKGALQPDAAGAAVLAYQSAREVDAYAYHAGLVYALSGDAPHAFEALHGIADRPKGSVWSQPAGDWIRRLKGGVSNSDILAALTGPQPRPEGWPETWHGQVDWTLSSEAVLGDANVQKGQEDMEESLRRLEKMKSAARDKDMSPTIGVSLPSDDR